MEIYLHQTILIYFACYPIKTIFIAYKHLHVFGTNSNNQQKYFFYILHVYYSLFIKTILKYLRYNGFLLNACAKTIVSEIFIREKILKNCWY